MKILGIPTKIDPSFLVLSFVLATGRGEGVLLIVEWMLVVFVSVLLHELGHALTARKFGASPSITLYSMGGLTYWQDELQLGSLKRLLISLAGPAIGFLFGGLVLLVGSVTGPKTGLVGQAYFDLLWVNIGWGIFNLLPMLPLDGGQVLVTLEEALLRKKTQIISHVISLLAALSIIYLAATFRMLWIALLGAWFAYSNADFLIKQFKGRRDQRLEGDLQVAYEAAQQKDFDRALPLIQKVRTSAHDPGLQQQAVWFHICWMVVQGNYQEAESEIARYEVLYGEEPYLTGILYFQRQQMAAALPHLRASFVKDPREEIGRMLTTALTEERKFIEALEIIKQPQMEVSRWMLFHNLHVESLQAQDFKMARETGLMAYELKPDPGLAYSIACAFALEGNQESGLHWLERAVETGFNDKNMIQTDTDIENLRTSPLFAEIVSKLEVQ